MFVKVVIVVVILACIGPFFIKGPDGEPLLTLDQVLPGKDDIAAIAPAGEEKENVTTTIYKWQDENGTWHFSNEPVDAVGVEAFELDGNINILPSNPESPEPVMQSSVSSTIAGLPEGVTSVTPEQLEEMMETVNSMQETVDQRKQEVDRALGNE